MRIAVEVQYPNVISLFYNSATLLQIYETYINYLINTDILSKLIKMCIIHF